MTIWPNIDQWVPVSTTVNPVTLTADVAVKNASTKEIGSAAWETGSMSNEVPTATATPKAAKTKRAGWLNAPGARITFTS